MNFAKTLETIYTYKKFTIKQNSEFQKSVKMIQKKIIFYLYRGSSINISLRRAKKNLIFYHDLTLHIFKHKVVNGLACFVLNQKKLETIFAKFKKIVEFKIPHSNQNSTKNWRWKLRTEETVKKTGAPF